MKRLEREEDEAEEMRIRSGGQRGRRERSRSRRAREISAASRRYQTRNSPVLIAPTAPEFESQEEIHLPPAYNYRLYNERS